MKFRVHNSVSSSARLGSRRALHGVPRRCRDRRRDPFQEARIDSSSN